MAETLDLKVVAVLRERDATQIITEAPNDRDIILDISSKFPGYVRPGMKLKADVENGAITLVYSDRKVYYNKNQ